MKTAFKIILVASSLIIGVNYAQANLKTVLHPEVAIQKINSQVQWIKSTARIQTASKECSVATQPGIHGVFQYVTR